MAVTSSEIELVSGNLEVVLHSSTKRYDEVDVNVGDEENDLCRWLDIESARVEMLRESSNKLTGQISNLHGSGSFPKFDHKTGRIVYYNEGSKRSTVLDDLTDELLMGTRVTDFRDRALIKFAIDYTIRIHESHSRKSDEPYSVHAFEAARTVAKAGAGPVSIICTLLHDSVEELIGDATKSIIYEGIPQRDGWRKKYIDKPIDEIPREVRDKILKQQSKIIHDIGSGVLYSIGLSFYELAMNFKPGSNLGKCRKRIKSIMAVIDKLSRPLHETYFESIQRFLYPPKDAVREDIFHGVLRAHLDDDFVTRLNQLEQWNRHAGRNPKDYLRSFVNTVDIRREMQTRSFIAKNSFRTLIGKIGDRLHNTRDMRYEIFPIPERLYAIGFKNIYFLQEADRKLKVQKREFKERPILEALANELNIAALYQVNKDVQRLEFVLDSDKAAEIRDAWNSYARTGMASRFTTYAQPDRFPILRVYVARAKDDKGSIEKLEGNIEEQYRHAIAIKTILERMLLTRQGIDDYRIKGFGPQLDYQTAGKGGEKPSDFAKSTFLRIVR